MADSDRDRPRRDAAGIGPYAGDVERLVPLSEMKKWDVAEGDPDIRHWEVRTVSGRDIGKVRELLVDPDQGEVVMLEIDLSASDRYARVPIRIVQIDRATRVIRVDSADVTPMEPTGDAKPAERDRQWADSGRVRYPGSEGETVVERRPVVEEGVVRHRVVDEPDVERSHEPPRDPS
jgi:sporulation protein YlmC with PRC-barrel domain